MIYPKVNRRLILKFVCVLSISFSACTHLFSQFHNQIDDVKTAADIDGILKTLPFGYNYGGIAASNPFEGSEYLKLYDSLKIKTWVKRDFDSNGYSDLLVLSSSKYFYCILDSGVNKFYLKMVTVDSFNCELFSVSPDSNFIIYHKWVWNHSVPYQSSLKEGKLVYKFGGILEYNEKSISHKIQKIELSIYGDPISKKIKLNSKRKISFQTYSTGGKYGFFKRNSNRLSVSEYKNIINYLNYMDFLSLENKYDSYVLDAGQSTLKITYNNGQIKKITDTGSKGTYSLVHFYDLLLESGYKLLRENKIKRRTPFEARR